MRHATASVVIAVFLSLVISGPALAQSGTAQPTAKRCLTRACRHNPARRTAARAAAWLARAPENARGKA